jgi:hypothetical protein
LWSQLQLRLRLAARLDRPACWLAPREVRPLSTARTGGGRKTTRHGLTCSENSLGTTSTSAVPVRQFIDDNTPAPSELSPTVSMLSNPPQMSGLHARHRQHRRQNSTPSAFDAVKIAPLPNIQQRRPVSHRRGLSLDVRAHPQLAPAPTPTALRPEYMAVSITPNNPGQPTTPQHALREAPHHSPARPGPSQPTFTGPNESDAFLISPQVAAQNGLRRKTACFPAPSPARASWPTSASPLPNTRSLWASTVAASIHRANSSSSPTAPCPRPAS